MKMSAEAEKVITLSLCKMAESRSTRRGGTSLHKHLLIASVLTKATRARSAFLDTWYMGDDTSDGSIDLNLSYQEADFPTDAELDSTVGKSSAEQLEIDPSVVEQVISMADSELQNSSSSSNASNDDSHLVAEVETDMDLPPDILSCVEKLGDLNERIFSSSQKSASSSSDASSSSSPPSQPLKNVNCRMYSSSENGIPDVIAGPSQNISPVVTSENIHEDSQQQLSSTLTYLDLDAGSSSTVVEKGPVATSTPLKRRREWCFEDDDENDEICGTGSLCIETPVQSQPKSWILSNSSSNNNNKTCKRLRFDDSGVSSPERSIEDEKAGGVPREDNDGFKAGSFRLTYEDVDGDDSDDDSFLDDTLSQGQQLPSQVQMAKARQRNDRRVPSASSSSGSCSDEDGESENSMEVDQITNLVQFISFNKQQNQAQNAANLRSISCVN